MLAVSLNDKLWQLWLDRDAILFLLKVVAYQTLVCYKSGNSNSSIITRNMYYEILLEYRIYFFN